MNGSYGCPVAALCLLLLLPASGARAAQVTGVVIDKETGRTVAGATVSLVRMSALPVRYLAETGTDGRFGIAGVPAGTFRVCTGHPGNRYLQSCQWSPAQEITLVSDTSVGDYRFQLEPGTVLDVLVTDPELRLHQIMPTDGADDSSVWATVTIDGVEQPMPL